MLPGGAQLNNIIPSQYIGTSPMAAFPIGIVCSLFCMAFLYLYFRYEFKKSRERGEHFDADERILDRISRFQLDAGVKPWLSTLPLVLIIVLINGFGMDLSYAVLCACVLAMVIGWKNLPDKLLTMNEGVKNVGSAMVTTATSVGFGGAVLSCSGAKIILDAIAGLSWNPATLLGIAASFAGLLTGNGGGGCDVAMDLLAGQYLAMGIHPELLHRIVAIATAGFSCLPHNGMLITIMDTCGYSAKQVYKYIFISTVISGFLCLTLAVFMGVVLYPAV